MPSHYVPHTKVPTLVFPTSTGVARHVALMIESLIRQNNSAGRPTVLGLPTGSTPVGLYRELIRMHSANLVDFSRVTTFNLDEYVGLGPEHPQSYAAFMRANLFDHVNVPAESTHLPDGKTKDVAKHCKDYETAIRRAGGIDLQLLGIGSDGKQIDGGSLHLGQHEKLEVRVKFGINL